MNYNEERINDLSVKLNSLIRRHKAYTEEIKALRSELEALRSGKEVSITPDASKQVVATATPEKKNLRSESVVDTSPTRKEPSKVASAPPEKKVVKKKAGKSSLEKFIGENLISKIGILIIIIGVAIGTKYSIDNGLLSPLTRIILGYVVGLGLLGFGIKLKQKYEKFSAVLVSGAMVVNYFVTFIAYTMFGLISKEIAFAVMVLFTVFTVLAAWNYKRQIIAILGLVGAYAGPFLLSDGTGEVSVLFIYMTIINLGILVVSIKQDWKVLNYLAFFFTWMIYGGFCFEKYNVHEHFKLSGVFLFIFFAIFYGAFLVYKFRKEEKFNIFDVLLLTLNSFVFYGLGYFLLDSHPYGETYIGLFTLLNAVIHFVVSLVIYKKKLIDPAMTNYVIALVLVFITIAIPVQLEGSWVTILWSFMAVALFFIGRWKKAKIYEILSYPLLLLGLGSLIEDWERHVRLLEEFTPVLNSTFLTSILVVVALGVMIYLEFIKKMDSRLTKEGEPSKMIRTFLAGGFITVIFATFFREIQLYGSYLYDASEVKLIEDGYDYVKYNSNLRSLNNMWLMIFTVGFFTVLTAINQWFIKSKPLGYVTFVINALVTLIFLAGGLFLLSELRANYLNQYNIEFYSVTNWNLMIRYVALVFFASLTFLQYRYSKIEVFKMTSWTTLIDLMLAGIILWILTSELIHWLDIYVPEKAYKLGVSILWGVFSLACVGVGIFKRKAHLRIGAIVIFVITLGKLFFYDIAHLGYIQKTIVFVVLGILLLIISFLYNKFKDRIANEK